MISGVQASIYPRLPACFRDYKESSCVTRTSPRVVELINTTNIGLISRSE